ncbi:MAG: hypothetical protein PHS14_12630 [Elusimicrobia bacterium]|nr:hypothetical protein [Elusimicrobiota bacterium]
MVRAASTLGFLTFGLLLAAVPSRAANPFDGGGSGGIEVPKPNLEALQEAAADARRSSADLYSFSKEEAAAAQLKFAFGIKAPRKPGFTFDADVPADIQAQMRADLAFIKGIAGDKATPLHRKIFGGVNGADYTKFFETRVSAIGMNGCGNGNAVACVIPFRDPSKMWLTKNFIRFSHPQVSRMMVVFHESRHTETQNGNWSHATCPTPFLDANGKDMKSIWTGATLAGEPACDETPLGSYGSSTIMLKNISKFCTNCTDKVKMDAGLYADDQMGRIIDADAKKQMKNDFNQ